MGGLIILEDPIVILGLSSYIMIFLGESFLKLDSLLLLKGEASSISGIVNAFLF